MQSSPLFYAVRDDFICRESQDSLQKSNNLLREMIEQASEVIFVKDLRGRYSMINSAGARHIGRPVEEIIGKTDEELLPPELARRFVEGDHRALTSGETLTVEEALPIGAEPRILLTTKTPYRDHAGEIVGLFGIGRDVTEIKRAEERLMRLATAVEQAADSIVITDAAANILYVNPAFERATGYSSEEALGQNPRMLKSGKMTPELYRSMWETLSRGDVWTGHFSNRRKDGTIFEEDGSISPIRNDAGEVVSYVAVKRDVTREFVLEEQLRQSQKMEAVDTLAGGVAHYFNNLLTAIGGYTDLALRKLKRDDPLCQYLEEVKKASARAASLTRQLLAFSRKQVLKPRALDLNAVVSDMHKMLARMIGEDISLRLSLDPRLGHIKADPGQIEQVIINLAVNARDAMPRGGMLIVETANIQLGDDDLALACAEPGPFVQLTMTDTGCGMDAATLSRVFEPFFTTKETGKGTGLGLATVYGIVKQSGGVIAVSSELGCCTTFKIYLPRVDAKIETVEDDCHSQKISRGTETILLVEDEEQVRNIARSTLESCGYRVLEAANGGEALLSGLLGADRPLADRCCHAAHVRKGGRRADCGAQEGPQDALHVRLHGRRHRRSWPRARRGRIH